MTHLAQIRNWGNLVSCPRQFSPYIRSYPPYWRPFLYPQPEDAPFCGDWDQIIMGHRRLLLNFWTILIIMCHNYRNKTSKVWAFFQMKPNRCTLILSIFISTSVHVSGNCVPIIRRNYCIYATLFFSLPMWGRLVCRPVSHPYRVKNTSTYWDGGHIVARNI